MALLPRAEGGPRVTIDLGLHETFSRMINWQILLHDQLASWASQCSNCLEMLSEPGCSASRVAHRAGLAPPVAASGQVLRRAADEGHAQFLREFDSGGSRSAPLMSAFRR